MKGIYINMAKIWKKLLLVILIIACLFNVVSKLVKRFSLKEELQASAQYVVDKVQEEQNKK